MLTFKHIMAKTAIALAIFSTSSAQAVVIKLDPAATYLRTSEFVGFPPHDAVAYSLESLGFYAGQSVVLRRLGDFKGASTASDVSTALSAVFSSSNILLGPMQQSTTPGTLIQTPLHRVPGAVATELPQYETWPSYHGLLPSDPKQALSTDILEDFFVSGAGVLTVIPLGAQYIFFSPRDNLFSDNTDPDGDFGVSIVAIPNAVPEPAGWALTSLALIGAAFFRRFAQRGLTQRDSRA